MRNRGTLIAYADGAIGNGGRYTGVGAIIMNAKGRILRWGNRQLGTMTNNEAEYAGLVLALDLVTALKPGRVDVYLDSEIVVGQMTGAFGVHSPALKTWHRRACHAARRLRRVTYSHVPRERNRLADALANEALGGHILHGP